MRDDIELAGFVLTAAEWAAMDAGQRAMLLRAALRRDDPWVVSSPPRLPRPRPAAAEARAIGDTREATDGPDAAAAYAAYELRAAV